MAEANAGGCLVETDDNRYYRDDSANSFKWSENQIDDADKHDMMQGIPKPRPV